MSNHTHPVTLLSQKKENDTLQVAANQLDNEDLVSKVKWIKKVAGQHAKLGDKLLATAKRIKAAGYHRDEGQADETNEKLIGATIHSYIILAAEQANKTQPDRRAKKQIRITWQEKRRTWRQSAGDRGDEGGLDDKHIKDIQQAALEFKEILVQVIGCDVTNTIHAAKIQSLGESHIAHC